MGRTKKVDSTGRFGSKYGVGIRRRVLKIELRQKESKPCPECGVSRVKRVQRGIFACRKCGYEFAGGAYLPETLAGRIIKKMVAQKSFAAGSSEGLVEATIAGKGEAEDLASEGQEGHADKKAKHKAKGKGAKPGPEAGDKKQSKASGENGGETPKARPEKEEKPGKGGRKLVEKLGGLFRKKG